MALNFETSVKVELNDAPQWLSHIEFTRSGDRIIIEVIKQNGLSYGEAEMPLNEFNDMADILLKPGS